MSDRIRELAEHARKHFPKTESSGEFWMFDEQKFAELIVKECIKQAHTVGDLRGVNDDMIFGADTAALKISKHFGVLE